MPGRLMRALGALALLAGTIGSPAWAQDKARIEQLSFDSPSLEGNLQKNDRERSVYVVTPPGYDENPDRRYPVVYFLHGFWMPPDVQQSDLRLDLAVQSASDAGHDFIMVMPDGYSKLRGGFYSDGPMVGDYEGMVADNLVAWTDANYRTIAKPDARGLSGHSMGGYGAIRIAMKRPGIFSSVYMMSACCLEPLVVTAEDVVRTISMTPDQVAEASFGEMFIIARLAAWSPDPVAKNFLHINAGLQSDGSVDPLVNQRLAANAPLALLPQYVAELKSLDAIMMDIGDADGFLEQNIRFRDELDRFGIANTLAQYDGDHLNRVSERLHTHVLPFFGKHLDNETP